MVVVETIDTTMVGMFGSSGKMAEGIAWVWALTSALDTIHGITVSVEVRLAASMMTRVFEFLSTIKTTWADLFEV